MNEAFQQIINEFFIDSGDIREYRVLTVWQPYASLLVHGIKKFETRPGPTSWTVEKGTYLIHAASKWTKEQEAICLQEPFLSELENINCAFYNKVNLPLGQIIGAVEIEECCRIYGEDNPHYFDKYVSIYHEPNATFIQYPELAFGDYREGRFAWLCQNPRLLKNPIPYKGGQGYYQRYKGDKSLIEFL